MFHDEDDYMDGWANEDDYDCERMYLRSRISLVNGYLYESYLFLNLRTDKRYAEHRPLYYTCWDGELLF